MSHPAADEPILRRKRVAKACQTCRLMKSKCDGRRPACGRCTGYGYACAYPETGRRPRVAPLPIATPPSQASTPTTKTKVSTGNLRSVVQEYEDLIQRILPLLPDAERGRAESDYASASERMEEAFSALTVSTPSTAAPTLVYAGIPRLRPDSSPAPSRRYHGEVSDVRFFNHVKHVLREKSIPDRLENDIDSYEQDDVADQAETPELFLELPPPEVADEYLDVYFLTIHAAYPYIPRSSFLSTYRRIRDTGRIDGVDPSWLGLLYTILAIGAYYVSFPGKRLDAAHEHLFHKALAMSNSDVTRNSVHHVSFLLAQCFYLLAVCRTDRCWNTLGLAVRVAQSIGLHVGSGDSAALSAHEQLQAETRHRTWYSLYVLDRLLALQLGRPPAIHDEDCHSPLPSRIDGFDVDWDGDLWPTVADGEASAGDYFLCMISFSRIMGHVLRDLYSPRQNRTTSDELMSTKRLDHSLLEWKWSLPRTLRFDFGHAFETSVTFKRQRNMLAIKFHHLRALIHRPYLCLPLLRQHPSDDAVAETTPAAAASPPLSDQDAALIDRYERVCVSEAKATAHLLHNVVSERDLVHDFPWWQMISCLICASSILLVASVFVATHRDGDPHHHQPHSQHHPGCEVLDATALKEDAETCMKVFEALSSNSEGARIARDMMTRLKERGAKWSRSGADGLGPPAANVMHASSGESVKDETTAVGGPSGGEDHLRDASSLSAAIEMHVPAHSLYHHDAAYVGSALDQLQPLASGQTPHFVDPFEWPSEIGDSMAWSAQFFDAVQGGHDGSGGFV